MLSPFLLFLERSGCCLYCRQSIMGHLHLQKFDIISERQIPRFSRIDSQNLFPSEYSSKILLIPDTLFLHLVTISHRDWLISHTGGGNKKNNTKLVLFFKFIWEFLFPVLQFFQLHESVHIIFLYQKNVFLLLEEYEKALFQ